jgi:dihydroorotate dehydrogenase (fumarate)
MMASALLHKGIPHAAYVLADLRRWLDDHEYDSVQQMRGSMSRSSVADSSAFERGNYMRVLSSYTFRSGAIQR